MGIKSWLMRTFGLRPRIQDGLPDVLWSYTDEQGQQHEVHKGPVQHDRLPPEQLHRVARLRDALSEAYPMTLDGWVDGFVRDLYPESEIKIIEAVAVVYLRLTERTKLSIKEKQQLYAVLCLLSAGGASQEIEDTIPRGLPNCHEIFEMYRSARATDSRP